MACCCKACSEGQGKIPATLCLGRCDLPKHRCLYKEEVKPGPIPSHMGWLYTARDGPPHQLRCGWRPGHISCSVLRKMENVRCSTCCAPEPCCDSVVAIRPKPYRKSCRKISRCRALYPCLSRTSTNCGTCNNPINKGPPPLIRIIRHRGQYSICTKPSNLNNAPSGPYPLKYVLNVDPDADPEEKSKFSIEAKFNNYQFDYTSSQSSFVLDFAPPETCK